MDEAGARAWLRDTAVPRETIEQLDRFAARLVEENGRQNLVSRASLDQLWTRHIVDSAQLLLLGAPDGDWADIGTGAGFPGLVVALLSARAVTLIEPRARRAAFLAEMVHDLGLAPRVAVAATSVERLAPARPAAVISARAVAPLDELFARASSIAGPDTWWLLPKGRSAANELAAARAAWQGEFDLRPSITDPTAAIVVARAVRPRNSR